MFNTSKIQMHEVTIEQAKETIELANALSRLQSNKDFNLVINNGYFVKEASRVVLLKASPTQVDDSDQRMLNNQIIGIGELRQYFTKIYQAANQAEKAIKDSEADIAELLTSEEEV